MIPLKLELTNFLSYRDTAVLDFNGIHLACIAGRNGAGKSSILDGVTYALFGRSRAKSDDDLVNRHAAREGEKASVRFTFSLEGSIYRVTRTKPVGKTTSLEFQVQMEAADRWKTLTLGKIRETQAEIEKLLRMNYDTFINASFLLQGKADEFTTKTANKRKEILTDLLGLGEWDVYKETAVTRRKQEEGQLALLDAQVVEIENELAQAEERQEALDEAKSAHDQIAQQLAAKQALLEQLRRTEAAVAQQKKNVQTLKANCLRAETALAGLQKKQAQRQEERAGYETILQQADEIAAAYAAWEDANKALAAWQEKADEFNRRQQAKRPYELAITQEKSRLEQRQRELEAQQQAAAAAVAEQAQVSDQITQAHERLTAVQTELEQLAQQEAEWHRLRGDLNRIEAEQSGLQREWQQMQERAAEVEKLRQEQTAVRQNLEAAVVELTAVTEEIDQLAALHQQYAASLAEKNTLEADQPRLRDIFKQKRERISQLSSQTGGDCPLCGQPLSAEHRQQVLAELEAELQEMEGQGKTNNDRIRVLAEEVTALDRRLQQSPRLEQQQKTQRERKARAEARLEEIEKSLAAWEAEGAARLAELETAVADQSAADEIRRQIATLETAVQARARLDQQRQTLEREIAGGQARLVEIERLTAQWQETGAAELQTVSTRLAQAEFDAAAQAALADLETEIAAIGYDADAHEAARSALAEWAQAPARQQQLGQAQAAVKPLEDALADLSQQIGEQEKLVTDYRQQVDTAVADLETLQQDGGDLRQVEDEVFRLREEEIQANRQVGVAQNRLDVLADLTQRKEKLATDRVELTTLIQRLKLLEKAMGREGVPSLLIEQAVPEIEMQANELLDRLTGGEMRITFATQEKLKSRDALRETLEIRIHDNAGERPYDNFSGGEQFRVNFAIRLALSQLLANRAGARLQTLVIDEGFGSQDPYGRQRLIEAINIIQNDFKVVLVITHIDELRDAFPTQIQIEKRPSGSAITVT